MRALALEGPLYRTIRGYRAAEAGLPKKRSPPALQVLQVLHHMPVYQRGDTRDTVDEWVIDD